MASSASNNKKKQNNSNRSAANKKNAKPKKLTAAQKKELMRVEEENRQRQKVLKREITGVILIFVGLFNLFSILPIQTGILGDALSGLFFGLFGGAALLMPIMFIVSGAAVIMARQKGAHRGKVIAWSALTVALFVFFHLLGTPEFDPKASFGVYIQNCFRSGKELLQGTGAIGGVLSFVLLKFFGRVGGYLFSVALGICAVLLITRISIAQVSRQVGHKVHEVAAETAQKVDQYAQERKAEWEEIRLEQKERREERIREAEEARYKRDMYIREQALKSENREFFSARIVENDAVPVNVQMQEAIADIYDVPAQDVETFELDRSYDDIETVETAPFDITQEISEQEDRQAEEKENIIEHQQEEPVFVSQEPETQEEPVLPFDEVTEGPTFVVAPPPQVPDAAKHIEKENKKEKDEFDIDTSAPDIEYRLPPIELMTPPKADAGQIDPKVEMEKGARILEETLASFGVSAKVVHVTRGPAITRYELTPAPGVKVSRITSLSDDIALNLAATSVRMEAPIPGKQAVGIEVPNAKTTTVTFYEAIDNDAFRNSKSLITAAIGKDITGSVMLCDLANMPHLLIAGATGAGKSVCINTLIASILYRAKPDEVRFIMIDPKVVELGVYNGIPHLLIPVVTDPKKAAGALGWAVQEMTERYKTFSEVHVRDIDGYNRYAVNNDLPKLPRIVIIIDELADLMVAAAHEVEERIQRIAQLARAAGMHLVIATQRPSVNVITGTIKANIPSRIAFAVTSQVDSRTILDGAGAEKLLGRGDMLYSPRNVNKPIRVQGAFIPDEDIEKLIEFIKNNSEAEYNQEIADIVENSAAEDVQQKGFHEENDVDDKFLDALELGVRTGEVSASMLQRKFGIGYPRAAKLIDSLERRKLITGPNGSKPRKMLITQEEFYRDFKGITPEPVTQIADDIQPFDDSEEYGDK